MATFKLGTRSILGVAAGEVQVDEKIYLDWITPYTVIQIENSGKMVTLHLERDGIQVKRNLRALAVVGKYTEPVAPSGRLVSGHNLNRR